MAIVSNVFGFLCQPFVKPTDTSKVGINLIKLTGRTIALAAISAITSAVLNKSLKQEGPWPALTSQFLRASLLTGATSAAVLIYYFYAYHATHSKKDFDKANRDTARFEKIIAYTGALARLTTFLASAVFFKGNETAISIARYSRFPLTVCMATAMIISIFHQHQLNQTT